MRIIDLLNKIANGEEVPKKYRYKNMEYEEDYCYMLYEATGDCNELGFKSLLNDEVKILEEEKKIPEKLNYQYRNLYGRLSQHKQSEIDIIDTLNGVIDYLKSKGE